MPSKPHEQKIEEIAREIQSRSLNWKVKKNYPIWLHKENSWGLIDVVGFKKETFESGAEVQAYEIEESSGNLQQTRNLEKLNQFKSSFPSTIQVSICQLSTAENHKEKCFKDKPKPTIKEIPKLPERRFVRKHY